MNRSINLYILIMFAVSYVIRALPLTLIRGKIRSPFLQSFLYYVPYITLAVMTFPAIIESTQTPVSGLLALIAGLIALLLGREIFRSLKHFGSAAAGTGLVLLAVCAAVWIMRPGEMIAQASERLAGTFSFLMGRIGLSTGIMIVLLLAIGYSCLILYRKKAAVR